MNTALVRAAGRLLQGAADSNGQPVLESSDLGILDWVVAGAILVVGIGLSVLARRSVVRILRRGTTIDTIAETLMGRVVQVVVIVLALTYSLNALEVRIGPLLGALGIGGIAVALALQETLKNLFAGVILHAQRPVRLGEEVVSGDTQGMVTAISSRAVTLRSNSGRTIFIPNSLVLDREIVNLVRHGVRRTTLVVGVAYDTDLNMAQEVIRRAAANADGVHADPAVRVLCSEFADSSVNFDIDFWHGAVETARREASSKVVIAVHVALGEAGITIPFPQRTVWITEGTVSAAEEADDGE